MTVQELPPDGARVWVSGRDLVADPAGQVYLRLDASTSPTLVPTCRVAVRRNSAGGFVVELPPSATPATGRILTSADSDFIAPGEVRLDDGSGQMVHLAPVAEVVRVHEPALPSLDEREATRARNAGGGPFAALRRAEVGMDDQSKGCLNFAIFWVVAVLLIFTVAIVVALVRAG